MNTIKTLFFSLLIALSTGCPAVQKLPVETEAPKSAPPVDDNSLVGTPPEWVVNPRKYMTPPAPQKDNNEKDKNGNVIPVVAGIAALGFGLVIGKILKDKKLRFEVPKVKVPRTATYITLEEATNRSLLLIKKYPDLRTDNVSQNTIDKIVEAARINGKNHVQMNRTVSPNVIFETSQSVTLENSELAHYIRILQSPSESLTKKKQAIVDSFNVCVLNTIESSAAYLDTEAFSRQERNQLKTELAQTMLIIIKQHDDVLASIGITEKINHSWATGITGAFNQLFPN